MEEVGEKFNTKTYFQVREQTKKLLLELKDQIHPGMKEHKAHEIFNQILKSNKIEKIWHPTKIRFGANTLKSFREPSDEDIVLGTEDLYFIDIGPVIFDHEGDFGETFQTGENRELERLIEASKSLFTLTEKAWREKKLTGSELYSFASEQAIKWGYHLNLHMDGHRIGDFPHAIWSKSGLGEINFTPKEQRWVLEIHLIDKNIQRGAFYEDILGI
jgi:Xaa-Pro aminopeptidase